MAEAMTNGDLGKMLEGSEGGKLLIPERPPNTVIVVDSREQKPYSFPDQPTEVKALETGDYSIRGLEREVTVERKSLKDLVNCVGRSRERFMAQLYRLKAIDTRLLLVEGDWDDVEAGEWRGMVTANAVEGTLLMICAMGIPVVTAGTRERAQRLCEKFLVNQHRRHWKHSRKKLHLSSI